MLQLHAVKRNTVPNFVDNLHTKNDRSLHKRQESAKTKKQKNISAVAKFQTHQKLQRSRSNFDKKTRLEKHVTTYARTYRWCDGETRLRSRSHAFFDLKHFQISFINNKHRKVFYIKKIAKPALRRHNFSCQIRIRQL